jgi:23S rRNA (cytosine1962-C5)-methyltransferase
VPRRRIALVKPLRERIAAGHPWVYDRAVGPTKDAAPGEVVTLADADGPVATAFADPDSPIRARILDRDPDATIDDAWARGRARAAAARRARDPLLVGCTGIRLVHGEADGCPGLVVDAYAGCAVLVFDGTGARAFWRPRLGAVLVGLAEGGGEVTTAWLRERRNRTGEAVLGDPPTDVVIAEDDARFTVDLRAGQKTGFFLDQRDNRRSVRRLAAGATVLNLFAYTGGFSIHAALGGAARVTSVDSAAPAIDELGRNLALSGLDASAHELARADAFEFLTRNRAAGRDWDLVIADPPSFAPSERARTAALAAYRKLATAALAAVAPGGRLALASCSSHVSEADLLDLLAPLGDLRVRHTAGAASDHPVLPAFPEGRYLKFLVFETS